MKNIKRERFRIILIIGYILAFLLRFGLTHFFPDQEILLSSIAYLIFVALLVYSFFNRENRRISTKNAFILFILVGILIFVPLIIFLCM